MKLKICGIRTTEMVRACHGGGVHYVGLNFVSDSRRKVLRMPDSINDNPFKLVGIFRDASLDFIIMNVKKYRLDVVQLHGSETPDFIDQLQEKLSTEVLDFPIWKALSVDNNFEVSDVQEYCKKCDLILFDSKYPGSGSLIIDHKKLQEAILATKKTGTKVGIAGGINAENIGKIRAKFPEANLLDTASGVEIEGDFSVHETRKLIQNFNA